MLQDASLGNDAPRHEVQRRFRFVPQPRQSPGGGHAFVLRGVLAREVLDNDKQDGTRHRDVDLAYAARRDGVHLLGERHELAFQRPALGRQEHVDLLAIAADLASRDVTEPLHRLERREGGRLHHAGFLAQLALGETVALPEDAQEGPVAERYLVPGEPHLQRAHQSARRVLDQMRQTIVGYRLAPVAQNGCGAGRAHGAGT